MYKELLKVEQPADASEAYNKIKITQVFESGVLIKVTKILENIRTLKEKALLDYCRKFDGLNSKKIDDIRVLPDEIDNACKIVPEKYPELVEALNIARKNVEEYHKAQKKNETENWFINPSEGKKLGQIITPVQRAGLYVPGGRYLYPSSVLMTAIPARVAGVEELVACSPPQKDGKINDVLLYLFSSFNISEIYKMGGAHAIGALAYGTESIKKVDKIAGPGNIYVTAAKKLDYGIAGIDSLAGPSEVMVIADNKSNPVFIASDLISQAEHDPDSRSILLTDNIEIAQLTIEEIYKGIEFLEKNYADRIDKELIRNSIKNNCKIFFNPSMDILIDICNMTAPEHLEIMVEDFDKILAKIRNAGAIFLGSYTPVAAGDYICGTNHVLPTGGNARFSSPLGIYDFCKKSSVAFYSREFLAKEARFIEVFSEFENLLAHNNSIKVRFKQ